MTPDQELEKRVEHPVFFMAGECVTEGEHCCKICGCAVQPGEIVAEVNDKWGIQLVHQACVEWLLEDLQAEGK